MSLTDEQKRIRRTGIGSSEIAAVVGLSPYATPLDVWRAKVEGLSIEETPAMKRGRILEDAVADWYAEDTGARLERCATIRHPESPIALATPDRIATLGSERRILEIKTANLRTLADWGEPGTDEVPQAYLLQVQWELACSGLMSADLAVLIAGDDFRIYHLKRDFELEQMLLERAESFWRKHVETRTPPELDGSESAASWLASRFPKDNGAIIPATPEAEQWVREYRAAAAEAQVAARRRDAAKNRLKEVMGEAKRLQGDGWTVNWSHVKGRERTDWAAVCAEARVSKELIQKHTSRSAGHRQFRPSWAKEQSDE
jgi:putative phage-type endonuclease